MFASDLSLAPFLRAVAYAIPFEKMPSESSMALTSRATHAHHTSPRSTGFCAIWG